MKRVTIIGAGLGGLSTGALLAKSGFRVTILEQHSIVGGCATTFKRGDFTCEVGLHKMDGVYTNALVVDTFKKLDVYKHIEFIKPNEFFSIRLKDSEFIMPNGIKEAKDALIAKFPNEKRGIELYFKYISKIAKSYEILQSNNIFKTPFTLLTILKFKSKSVSEVLEKIITDKELFTILNANVQYYNDSPKTLSFLLHSIAQYSYFSGGGYFIKGGSSTLSNYLAKVIKENGGAVITKANVTAANKNSVEYMYKKQKHILLSDIIISNISQEQTYKLFNIEYKEHKELANSLLTIYLGFSKNLKTIYGKRAYSNFIDNFAFVDYSQIDSNLSPKDKSFGAICFIDSIKNWESLDKSSYKAKKDAILQEYIKKLEKHYPNITDYIEYAEVGTPKTVKRYIKTPNGTAYGYKPTPKQFFKIPKVQSKKIKNLYFVGQFVIAGGFSPAIISGAMCAKELSK